MEVLIGLVIMLVVGYTLYNYVKMSGVIKELSNWLEEIEEGAKNEEKKL